jgi:hypothetical protein
MPGSDPADLAARAGRAFPGPVVVGEDLMRFALKGDPPWR